MISSKHKSSTKKQEVTVFHEQKMGNAALRGYDCDFLEPPPDALLCLICTFVAREPMQMDCCGKLYCKHCLNEHSKLSQQFTCPHCRQDGNGFIDRKSKTLDMFASFMTLFILILISMRTNLYR